VEEGAGRDQSNGPDLAREREPAEPGAQSLASQTPAGEPAEDAADKPSPLKGSANRTAGRRRKNERKEDVKGRESKAKEVYSAVKVEESEAPLPGEGTVKMDDLGQLGTEGNVSQFAQSQEYSFARNPNCAQLEGVTVIKNEDRRQSERPSPASKNLFAAFAREEADSQLDGEHQEDEPRFPMTCEDFLLNYRKVMLSEEIQELETGDFQMIYFGGLIQQRTEAELPQLRQRLNERIADFNQKKMQSQDTSNGEFQGNPVFDNYEGYYKVQIGDHIGYRYEIIKILGKGSFAQVVECRDHSQVSKPIFAVKITRNTEMDHKFAHKEAQYLRYIMQEDPHDKHNIVRMLDQCYFRDHQCFVFELLHTDLFEHLKATGFVGFSTDKIRDYAVQLLKGLVFLEKHKIIHCDLKPENILCADTMCRNLKIVDFGSGCFRDEQIYTYVQSRFYRSPEVILRIKYTEKVDIWSLGCILAELYTGEPIFPGNNE
jgi:hypothetical protein